MPCFVSGNQAHPGYTPPVVVVCHDRVRPAQIRPAKITIGKFPIRVIKTVDHYICVTPICFKGVTQVVNIFISPVKAISVRVTHILENITEPCFLVTDPIHSYRFVLCGDIELLIVVESQICGKSALCNPPVQSCDNFIENRILPGAVPVFSVPSRLRQYDSNGYFANHKFAGALVSGSCRCPGYLGGRGKSGKPF